MAESWRFAVHWVRSRHAETRPRPAAAPCRRDETPLSGSRPTRPARSRCSGTSERTFTRLRPSLRDGVLPSGLEPSTRHEYEVRARRRARLARARLATSRPARSRPTRRSARCSSCSAPAASPRRTCRPTRCARTRTRAAARSTRCTRSPSGCASESRDELAGRAADARRPGLRRRGLARHAGVHRGAPRHSTSRRASGCSTSRSTRSSTRRAGPSPTIRWLFSTVSTAMIFDDHDVHDDWNISAAWLEEMRGHRLVGRAHRSAR